MSTRKQRLFGTDGIRGTANQWPLSANFVVRIGQAIAQTLNHEGDNPNVLIGRDPRRSGHMLEHALVAGLTSHGVDTMLVGTIPTPGVAYLTRKHGCQLGIVISASHNSFEHNGIKVFAADGFKIPDETEIEIERLLLDSDAPLDAADTHSLGSSWNVRNWRRDYGDYLVETWAEALSLQGKRIVIDCANGATSEIAPEVFRRLGAHVEAVHDKPDGVNINESYEYVQPKRLAELVLRTGADVGVAFDGDGDRVILVDEQGDVLDGDVIMAILARHLHARDKLVGNVVVTTSMSNYGLQDSLRDIGARVVETRVGDRYVLAKMLANGYMLGGERSGHILVLENGHTTGDGIFAALAVMAAVTHQGSERLSDLSSVMPHYLNIIESAAVSSRPSLQRVDSVRSVLHQIGRLLATSNDPILRTSGTDNEIRLGVEEKGSDSFEKTAEAILRYSGTEEVVRLSVRSRTNDDSGLVANEVRMALRQIAQGISDWRE
ncbi:MAG: phosphoglucosamine mutase [Anaerolineae bacterium]|jgi:phosphoglucosamine mutase